MSLVGFGAVASGGVLTQQLLPCLTRAQGLLHTACSLWCHALPPGSPCQPSHGGQPPIPCQPCLGRTEQLSTFQHPHTTLSSRAYTMQRGWPSSLSLLLAHPQGRGAPPIPALGLPHSRQYATERGSAHEAPVSPSLLLVHPQGRGAVPIHIPPPLGRRMYATERGSAHDARVSPSLLRALPFTVSAAEAEQTFLAYLRSNPFLASPTSHKQVKETFIPFWLVQMTVHATATQAQVGHRVAVQRLNPSTRRVETVWETQWSVGRAAYARHTLYPPEEHDMQVCATHKYLEADMAVLRPGDLVATGARAGLLRPITAPGMLTPDRRVVPFSVRPADARAQAMSWVRRQEREAAEQFYRRAFNAEEVRLVDLELRVTDQANHPVYVPVYVFSRDLPGGPPKLLELISGSSVNKLNTFVSGVSQGVASGSQVYDPIKVGLAAGLLGPFVLLMTGLGALLTAPQLLLFGVVLPAVGGGLLARNAPHVRHAAAGAKSTATRVLPGMAQTVLKGVLGERLSTLLGIVAPEGNTQEEEGTKDGQRMQDAWVRAYGDRRDTSSGYQSSSQQRGGGGYGQQQQRSQQQSQWSYQQGGGGGYQGSSQQQSRASPSGGPRGDPKGYYALLGVKPGATASEVQEAFRARALQQHPDRFTNPSEKASATAAFQKLSEAYGVLRNPTKRAAYDAGMQV